MRKPRVGEKLFVCYTNRYHNTNEEVQEWEAIVEKVGRKYFHVILPERSYDNKISFHLDTWWEVTDYTRCYRIYENKQAYLDEREGSRLFSMLRECFYQKYINNFTLDQLRATCEILKINTEGVKIINPPKNTK